MADETAPYWQTTIHRQWEGADVAFDLVICSPADWEDVREAIAAHDWPTFRFQTFLMAFGPMSCPSEPSLLARAAPFALREIAARSPDVEILALLPRSPFLYEKSVPGI